MDWYYVAANQQVGPINESDFDALVRSGAITADTQVWHEGMTEWQRHGSLASGAAKAVVVSSTPIGTTGVVCSECGQTFPPDEVIRYGSASVCAACKPIFVQKLKEGVVRTTSMEYAGFLTRFAAVFVDGIIMWFVNFLVGILVLAPIGISAAQGAATGSMLAMQGILFLVQLAIGITYEVWFIGKFGATPGKMACKIKVVTADGLPVGYGLAFGRYFAKMLSGIILGIGYFMAAFDDQKRALHDRLCNTRVVKVG